MKRREEKELGFKIPENYFENFETSIQNNIQKRHSNKIISLHSKRKFYIISSVAAVLILVITLVNTFERVASKSENVIVEVNNFKGDQTIENNELLDYYISESDQNDVAEYYLIENALTDVLENP